MTSTVIRRIQNKNNCQDIFLHSKLDNGEYIYKPMAKSQLVAMKYNKNNLRRTYDRINLFVNLKIASKLNLLRCILQRINISKEMLLSEVQKGNEVFILKDLSQDQLPFSMRFYDPIFQIIQDQMEIEKKEFYYFLNQTNYNNYKKHSISTKVKDFVMHESIISKKRHLSIKTKIDAHIDHNRDEHAMEIQ